MDNRIAGYDFIRSFSFFFIYLHHIVHRQVFQDYIVIIVKTLAAISICLLGFISSVLLTSKHLEPGIFLIRRLTRIYIPLILCLTLVMLIHAFIGKNPMQKDAVLHLMGLSAFFDLLGVKNRATIGQGLWFISTIIVVPRYSEWVNS